MPSVARYEPEGTPKGEAIHWQTRDGQRRCQGRCAWDRFHANSGGDRLADQVKPRIRHEWRPGVGHQRKRLAGLKAVQQHRRLFTLVVFVQADHGGLDLVMVEQLARSPRILGCDR